MFQAVVLTSLLMVLVLVRIVSTELLSAAESPFLTASLIVETCAMIAEASLFTVLADL